MPPQGGRSCRDREKSNKKKSLARRYRPNMTGRTPLYPGLVSHRRTVTCSAGIRRSRVALTLRMASSSTRGRRVLKFSYLRMESPDGEPKIVEIRVSEGASVTLPSRPVSTPFVTYASMCIVGQGTPCAAPLLISTVSGPLRNDRLDLWTMSHEGIVRD